METSEESRERISVMMGCSYVGNLLNLLKVDRSK